MKVYMPTRMRLWGDLAAVTPDSSARVVLSSPEGGGIGFFVGFADRAAAVAAFPDVSLLEFEMEDLSMIMMGVQGLES